MRTRSNDSGTALVELAVTLPVLIALVVGTADFARVFYTAIELSNAARAGAQYGAQTLGSCCSAAQHTVMESTTQNAVNIAGITAHADHLCQCATDAGVFSDTAPFPNNCTAPPAASCPGGHRVISVSVTAQAPFTTLSPYPGIPRNLTIVRDATLRVTE